MERITPDRAWPLFDVAGTRLIEQAAAAVLAPHTLMRRAGLAAARLALALAPHARTIWVACGPGNNGGDGLETAVRLQQWGKEPVVTWLGDEGSAPPDALCSLQRARDAGVMFSHQPPAQWDLCIDALLGIGASRAPADRMADWIGLMNGNARATLAIDIPSGLNADTGCAIAVRAACTLSLLTLKPGLFTAQGRDACGQTWFDPLEVPANAQTPVAWLGGPPPLAGRAHASHKGSYGDVAVVGGAPGMTGAALLAATAALHHGAGRVFVSLLDGSALGVDTLQPELMMRPWDTLDLTAVSVACGCGGGDAVRAVLPRILSTAGCLVLDADALNAIAVDAQLQALLQARSRRTGRATVLTPHPLEAARLLGVHIAQIQEDRLSAVHELALRFGCAVVLKGSGSIVGAPGAAPVINPTGNARLATAGTGDVLAGMVAARLAAGYAELAAACAATFEHGLAADLWPPETALTASRLASRS